MKKIIRFFTTISSVAALIIFTLIIYGDLTIPDKAEKTGGGISLNGIYTVNTDIGSKNTVTKNDSVTDTDNNGEIRLLGSIPVKTINTTEKERKYLIPGGELVGLRLKTDGVLIVGTESFETDKGTANPAADAGISVGDTLISIDDVEITTNAQLSQIITGCDGSPLDAEIIRDGEILSITLTPEISAVTGLYKCGMWIRDSTGGIGTLTYYDTENGTFATLGHGIYDTDTGQLLPTGKGEISGATLTGIKKGNAGTAGELKGTINDNVFGDIISNNENGIYGKLNILEFSSDSLPIAYDNEIKSGKAQIICTVEGSCKDYYEIEIEKINRNDENKNMIIEITDERLLGLTGGIVQGMSGSPIIQNGRIVGAVTHVFVNEPTKGYGITIENMLSSAQ